MFVEADVPTVSMCPKVTELLKNDGAVLSHIRVQELWEATSADSDSRQNNCGVFRLAPVCARAWGRGRELTRLATTVIRSNAGKMTWKAAGPKPRRTTQMEPRVEDSEEPVAGPSAPTQREPSEASVSRGITPGVSALRNGV